MPSLFCLSNFCLLIICSTLRTSTWICWRSLLTLSHGETPLTVSEPLPWSVGLCWDRYKSLNSPCTLDLKSVNSPDCISQIILSPFFRQVVGANLLSDAVTWLYTRVLSGLQMHGQHDGCSTTLTQLALLIYDALVCFSSEKIQLQIIRLIICPNNYGTD